MDVHQNRTRTHMIAKIHIQFGLDLDFLFKECEWEFIILHT